jgi:hypothetical protein
MASLDNRAPSAKGNLMTDHVRRGVLQAFALSSLGLGLSLTGCASGPSSFARRSYTETITSVLISEDGAHLVAIGSNHHYVFAAPATLVQALKSPVHAKLTGIFTPFHVDAQGDVTGEVSLQLADDASDALRSEAESFGFVRDSEGHWHATSRLTGHRFAGWTYQVGLARDKLNHPYTVEVTSEDTATSTIVDSVGTPIRIAADGVQLIYYAPLAPIIIPMIFLLSARDH